MTTDSLIAIFERDLNKVIHELNEYKDESNIWVVKSNVANSAGNLALHLVGNLNTFIGKEIGKTDYVRDRPLEFSQKNISKSLIINQINETIKVIKKVLTGMTDDALKNEYPILVLDEKTSTEFFLIHLSAHLAYHLGQINYHRRLIEES